MARTFSLCNAIREGIKIVPYGHPGPSESGNPAQCVMNTAAVAVAFYVCGLYTNRLWRCSPLRDQTASVFPVASQYAEIPPESRQSGFDSIVPKTVGSVAMYLNDYAGWSRERILEWLDPIEDKFFERCPEVKSGIEGIDLGDATIETARK